MGVVVLWCTLSLLLLLSWLGSLSQHEREVMNAPPKKLLIAITVIQCGYENNLFSIPCFSFIGSFASEKVSKYERYFSIFQRHCWSHSPQ